MEGTVYVIMKGCYSDRHICAVTMDKARADKLRQLFDEEYEEADIVEWTLDEVDERRRCYTVEFPPGKSPIVKIYEWSWLPEDGSPMRTSENDHPAIRVLAENEDYARKIACDEYAMWKAEMEGIC